MSTELDRYYQKQGIRKSIVGKIIRRIKRDVPAEINDRAVLEIKMTDSKNAYELTGVHWALEDMLDVLREKLRLKKH